MSTMSLSATATIRELRARAVRVPMPEPHRTASGVIAESPLVLVDVVTSDGVVGHGIVFTYSTAALAATTSLVQELAPLVVGSRAGAGRALARALRALPTARHAGPRRHGDWRGSTWRSGTRWRARTAPRWCACSAASSGRVRGLRRGRLRRRRRGGAHGRGVGGARVHRRQGEDRLPRRRRKTSPSCAPSATPSAPAVAIMVDYNQSLTPTEAIGAHPRARREKASAGSRSRRWPTTSPATRSVAQAVAHADPVRRELVGPAGHAHAHRAEPPTRDARRHEDAAASPAGCGPRRWPKPRACASRPTSGPRSARSCCR